MTEQEQYEQLLAEYLAMGIPAADAERIARKRVNVLNGREPGARWS